MREIYTVLVNSREDSILKKNTIAGKLILEGGSLLFTTKTPDGRTIPFRVYACGTWSEVYLSDEEGNPIEPYQATSDL